MAIPTYVPGYPPDGSSLGQTKTTIRNNLDGTFLTLGVDHVNNNGVPGSQPPGYHTIIHQVPQTSVSTVAGYNQLFTGVPGTLIVNGTTTPTIPPDGNTQLYSLNSGGGLHQLTGAILGATNGYAWMGGVLVQWGRRNFIGGNTERATILFATANINFPNNVFNMQAVPICKSGGTSNNESVLSIVSGTVNTTSFQYNFATTSPGSYTQFYWLAIGN